ncbi:hypothetical protein AtNW77_Chr00c003g0323731 [Arabidopsis thaliana]|uniref:Defensin-like protein 207 n=4 Tax=Arabidopsis TaxID=3701 RepID=DF207_ARATH|nr:Defensin-like (DEFL) family protein [Arabidopsis thaliana]Q3E8R5.1 RecName: Full=Defensin-like protein 207; Flags: Precursor [Arabidopsis thaliana]KAG7531207.1 hypothetical protein ISN44_Un54g000050 [Arabidopsis suecica]KAG7603860.1 hypothetical protein ISN45_At05g029100 [Arabidopsis thaliana x Arabidopsis arenosa]AED93897.1 Defensin-like (DEFL) family protein [Arabidopsis thaliana]OAO90187.1 hypothetical protein AXX17_AT5G32040 [Arabidopsis thaliana]CAA0405490.1 unnamed protein product [A|eukprot:NP_680294.1 Defensin-like (DEFL) family protein [Arabidopsis thaliana]
MAKNLNSVSFIVLLLVLLVASTEILKSDAACFTFLGECGPEPFTGSNADCLACCVALYKSPPVCAGRVEGVPAHCHCYKS